MPSTQVGDRGTLVGALCLLPFDAVARSFPQGPIGVARRAAHGRPLPLARGVAAPFSHRHHGDERQASPPNLYPVL